MSTRIATASGMAVVTAIALAAVTACSSSSSSSTSAAVSTSASASASASATASSGSNPLSGGGASGSVVVGSANFPESELLAEVYALALQAKGVKFNMRVNHGVTHSVYISDPNGYGVELLYELPREMWERDIDAGINYFEPLPTEGPDALVDDLERAPSFGKAAAE